MPPDLARSERKVLIEDLDAAVFAHGLRQIMPDRDVCIAEFEAQDHDFVLRFGPPEHPAYCPFQLKVLVPNDVNQSLSPESLLDRLNKYADASDLVVVIKVDRQGVDPRVLHIPSLRVGELWFFGPDPDTRSGWYLYGDCLGTPIWFQFHLPEGEECAV